jgi:sugar-specific transcriptional regulator TrmB
MSTKTIEDLKRFLKSAKLSSYETNVYLTLLLSNHLTARELSDKSNVPSGRIYEVLEELNEKRMVEIQDSRPKMYRAKSFNLAFKNLISYIDNVNKSKVSYLVDQANILEANLYNSNFLVKKEPSRVFWQTAYGAQSIISMYVKYFHELQDELLMIDFINKNTVKILPYGKKLFEGIKRALEHGVRVKILWSFGFDDRPLLDDQKIKNSVLFKQISEKLLDLYNLSTGMHEFEMKFIYKRIPSYYDIFDKKRIIFKLQNPLNPWQIFASMNVLDPTLAKDLREKYYDVWTFEAFDEEAQ